MERVLSPRKRNMGAAVSSAGFLVVLLALLLDPQTVRESVANSIGYCLSVLTPSLFPFMALSCYAVNSPAAGFLGRPLEGLTRRVFRLPGCCAVPILMGMIGGYPAGARGASLLLEEGRITREQAGRMLLFCVNPGLAFTVTFLGAGLFGSARLGWLLFLSVAAPGLLLGMIAAIGAPVPEREAAGGGGSRPAALMRSVTDSARSVLMMCACIVLFAGFAAILHSLGVFQGAVRMLSRIPVFSPMEWAAVLSFLLEVTGGVGDAARLSVSPTFYAFGLAFGGLCVHMQVFAFFDRLPVKLWRFWLFRLLHGLLAAGCFWGLGRLLLGGAVQAMAPIAGAAGFSGSVWGGASLLAMCVAFLVIAGEGRRGRRSG